MKLIILGVVGMAIPAPLWADPIVTIATSLKTENQRPNGGVVISHNPVWVQNLQITDSSGVYLRLWSTIGARKDTEIRPGIGLARTCLGRFTCRVEIGYWASPDLAEAKGDVIALSSELSGKQNLGNASVGFSLQGEYLAVRGRPDTQIVRGDVNYTRPFAGVPVRFQIGYARNMLPGWSHVPVSVSGTLRLSRHVSFVPSIEGLFPLDDTKRRRSSVAAGFTLIWKSR